MIRGFSALLHGNEAGAVQKGQRSLPERQKVSDRLRTGEAVTCEGSAIRHNNMIGDLSEELANDRWLMGTRGDKRSGTI
jgi:hypothetical protein